MRWISPIVASVGATKSAAYPATAKNNATPSVASPCMSVFFDSIVCDPEAILNPGVRGSLPRVRSLLQQIFREKPGHGQKYSIKRGQHANPNRRQRWLLFKESR